MQDLNKTLFFRTQFEVVANRPGCDILWQIVLKVRKWMCEKWASRGVELPKDNAVWTAFKFGGYLTSPDAAESVSFKSSFYSDQLFGENPVEEKRMATDFEWACVITEAYEEEGCAPRDWTSEISYKQKEPDHGTLAVIISYADRAGYLGPVQEAPFFNVPRIVRWFLNDRALSCNVGGIPATMAPYEVSADNIREFWDMLSDPAREQPVVYVSPRVNDEGKTVTLIDPRALNWALGPNALVAYATDTAVSRAMFDVAQDDTLRCTGGAVRVYAERPAFGQPGETYRHRFFSAQKIEELGADTVVAYIARALSRDVHYYHDMLRKKSVDAHLHRAQLEERAREERLAEVAQTEEHMLGDMIGFEDRMRAAQEEADVYAAEVDDLSEQLFNAKAQIEGLKAAMAAGGAGVGARGKAGISLEAWPPSPESIVRLFLAAYPDRFDLTDAAWDSLKDCTTSPDILWNALNDLVKVAWPLYEDGSGDIEKAFGDQSRFELAKTEGKMTKADPKLMAGYDDVYHGTTYSCMAHIINGVKESDPKFIRIYFCFARQEGKVVVSHIGKHKTNYLTGRL